LAQRMQPTAPRKPHNRRSSKTKTGQSIIKNESVAEKKSRRESRRTGERERKREQNSAAQLDFHMAYEQCAL